MKNAEVIVKISQITGIESGVCQTIVKSFEKTSENALVERIKGMKKTREEIFAEVSTSTGVEYGDCERVLLCLNELVEEGTKGKFNFFKKENEEN